MTESNRIIKARIRKAIRSNRLENESRDSSRHSGIRFSVRQFWYYVSWPFRILNGRVKSIAYDLLIGGVGSLAMFRFVDFTKIGELTHLEQNSCLLVVSTFLSLWIVLRTLDLNWWEDNNDIHYLPQAAILPWSDVRISFWYSIAFIRLSAAFLACWFSWNAVYIYGKSSGQLADIPIAHSTAIITSQCCLMLGISSLLSSTLSPKQKLAIDEWRKYEIVAIAGMLVLSLIGIYFASFSNLSSLATNSLKMLWPVHWPIGIYCWASNAYQSVTVWIVLTLSLGFLLYGLNVRSRQIVVAEHYGGYVILDDFYRYWEKLWAHRIASKIHSKSISKVPQKIAGEKEVNSKDFDAAQTKISKEDESNIQSRFLHDAISTSDKFWGQLDWYLRLGSPLFSNYEQKLLAKVKRYTSWQSPSKVAFRQIKALSALTLTVLFLRSFAESLDVYVTIFATVILAYLMFSRLSISWTFIGSHWLNIPMTARQFCWMNTKYEWFAMLPVLLVNITYALSGGALFPPGYFTVHVLVGVLFWFLIPLLAPLLSLAEHIRLSLRQFVLGLIVLPILMCCGFWPLFYLSKEPFTILAVIIYYIFLTGFCFWFFTGILDRGRLDLVTKTKSNANASIWNRI